ncbi:probable C-mannosyltransferase DPY19L4 isoform X2 [Callorhinchus milii]|uniref:Dpy-19 like 4 n=2 Tax=Callorhinchus milii TaxID=7868 RepID=A0A4W3GTM9_CALMI|nr:probable C-mannosyltransferase DPY19L4 isoform X2 [Callorhinchus milii]|eukprot:gi/632941889/ref/XP_007886117.1/ PREDICTED: probable C-mannosyltransferase DPY19L4 isoform X2 [Callorhinchus milii]
MTELRKRREQKCPKELVAKEEEEEEMFLEVPVPNKKEPCQEEPTPKEEEMTCSPQSKLEETCSLQHTSEDSCSEQPTMDKETRSEELAPKEDKPTSSDKEGKSRSSFHQWVKVFFGSWAAIASGMMYAVYLSTFHERKFWFSNRQDLEREISFQADSGLYYYYYKKMLQAGSIQEGLFELMHDNKTLSMRTLNSVQQIHLYPEVFASILYRVTGSQEVIDPVYFYIGIIFGLQAVYVTALYITSWMLSGTWMAGMLTVVWYIINRTDTTRVEYAIPLRENWALPYFALEVAALTSYLKININSTMEMFSYLLMSASTFAFIMMWEISHYVLFVQAISLFLVDCLDLVQTRKQNLKNGHFVVRLMKLLLHFYLVFTVALTLNLVIKKMIPEEENEHILKFFEAKFDLNTTRDFNTNLLLCQETFQSPSQDFFIRLTHTCLLPFCVTALLICLFSTFEVVFKKFCNVPQTSDGSLENTMIGQRPEVVYHMFHTVLFGSLALMFQGLKYLWTPYACMFTAFGVCAPQLWLTVFKWFRLKTIPPVFLALMLSTAVPTIIGFSMWRDFFPEVMDELSELQEFYDTDTVELMNWIRKQTPTAAVLAGSMQLMGTVKLCTGRTVTTHPLYSDKDLRKRTEEIYQVYSRRSAEDIYMILTSYKTNYVVVEEGICNEMGPVKGCRVKDLLDVANGHMLYRDGDTDTNHPFSVFGRFCHEIKLDYSPYVNYFTRVYWNRSYHVYKVNTLISFQY